MVNDACISPPHFQRYIQAPILHGKGSGFPMEAPWARHVGQTRPEGGEGEPPWSFLQHAQCGARGQQQTSTNPIKQWHSYWERRVHLPVLSSRNIKKVPAFSGQRQHNWQHLQKPQLSTDKKWQPPHPVRAAGAKWEVGAARRKKNKTKPQNHTQKSSWKWHYSSQPELLPSFLQTCTSYWNANAHRSPAQNYPVQHLNVM